MYPAQSSKESQFVVKPRSTPIYLLLRKGVSLGYNTAGIILAKLGNKLDNCVVIFFGAVDLGSVIGFKKRNIVAKIYLYFFCIFWYNSFLAPLSLCLFVYLGLFVEDIYQLQFASRVAP